MLGAVVVSFLVGCIVGAVVNNFARRHQERSAAQNLLRALDSGTIHYGHAGRGAPVEQDPNRQTSTSPF